MKKLNLDLFDVGDMFLFKGNRHLVIKSYREGVLTLDLDYDELECLEELEDIWSIDKITYNLSYVDIEEHMVGLGKDGLRYLVEDGSLEG